MSRFAGSQVHAPLHAFELLSRGPWVRATFSELALICPSSWLCSLCRVIVAVLVHTALLMADSHGPFSGAELFLHFTTAESKIQTAPVKPPPDSSPHSVWQACLQSCGPASGSGFIPLCLLLSVSPATGPLHLLGHLPTRSSCLFTLPPAVHLLQGVPPGCSH